MSSSPPRLCAAAFAAAALWVLWTPVGRAHAPASTGASVIELAGATYLEYDEGSGVWRAEGAPAVATRGTTVLRAPRIRYDQRTRVMTAEAGAELTDANLAVRADSVEFHLADDRIRARGAVRATTGHGDQTATLTAPEVEGSLKTRRYVATGGVTLLRGEWRLSGRRLEYDDSNRTAAATGEPEARFRDAQMTADLITLLIDEEIGRGIGSARLRRGDLSGSARRVDVFLREGRATLTGDARVDRGRDRLTAEQIDVDLDGTRITARGAPRLNIVPP
ncbi:MAG: hypothetical protein FJX73_07355 [Armatimonadetes bacterium]|nr:hypothetical protein [Armatimonadota bacterium]